jgi:multiple sugar transport system permease protein
MVSTSLLSSDVVFDYPKVIVSSEVDLTSYFVVFYSGFMKYLKNTVIVVMFNVIGIPLVSSICAYGFSKIQFKGRDACFGIVLATLMLPAIVTQIPLYVIFVKLGWNNTLNPLIIPSLFGGGATNIFLMRQFMKGIPNDICNSAKIDGANSFTIYWKIMMPLCIPITVFIMVTTFMGVWNDFMGPLMYINKSEYYTLSVGIYKKYGGDISFSNPPNISMAAGVLMSIPCVIMFFIFQKQLVEGVTITGLKG